MAYRIFREYLNEKYGIEEARKRTYITTDKVKGALKKQANENGLETFVIPDNVGGRYSVLTAVGLLPIAVVGINIDSLLDGAIEAYNDFSTENLEDNNAYIYAVIRNILYEKRNKDIEILATFEPKLRYFIEWYKQLFAESEGKDGQGLFPTGAIFTTDLHSIGQLIQDGQRNIFETFLEIENVKDNRDIVIKKDSENYDGLNYLTDKTIKFVENQAKEGTIKAHASGKVPVIRLKINSLDAKTIGYLIYFFEITVMMSGKLLRS